MKPTIGRTVHYWYFEADRPSAAIINRVNIDGTVDLTIFPDLLTDLPGVDRLCALPFSEVPKPGHWNWPPRVEENREEEGWAYVHREKHEVLCMIAERAQELMGYLEKHGPNVVPHLMDTGDNSGQRLRTALCALKRWA